MKKFALEFIHRGCVASGSGPLVLVALYLILERHGVVELLTVREVCLGIVTLSALAFVAGGMNVIYQIERLPLMVAILIHGSVLYLCYLVTYLVNGWLESERSHILSFTAIFILGYLAIWAVIYVINKRNTEKVNETLRKRQKSKADF